MNAPDIRMRCVASYERHKKLLLVGQELGIPWQTAYVYLRQAGVAVTGDKARYGSETDKLAARAEADFERLVPFAQNQNKVAFQAKVDFLVGPLKVDIKAATLRPGSAGSRALRWAFSMKKQELTADFIVCFGYHDAGKKVFLLPGELIRKYQSISVSYSGPSKWGQYTIDEEGLAPFFQALQ